MHHFETKSTGLGLRWEFINEIINHKPASIDFCEITPENWMQIGGLRAKCLQQVAEYYPLIAHGLSLSIGSPAPLDETFIQALKQFLDRLNINLYSEHLSFCSDHNGFFYDLLPVPFTSNAVSYIADRIKRTQTILERQIVLENISYYYLFEQQLSEIDFINQVLMEANCKLLLDINNLHVNSKNHHYDPIAFLEALPTEKIAYIHIAGHHKKTSDLLIDTHGNTVCESVWQLLEKAYEIHGIIPTLLERDNDIPPFSELLTELTRIKQAQALMCKNHHKETSSHANA